MEYDALISSISKITLSVAIPDDEILSEVVGLSKKDFDFLGNIKTKTATFKLVASKNKNLLKSSNELGTFIERIKERFGDSVQHINVNAKITRKESTRLPNGTTDDEWKWKSRGSIKTNF